MSDSKELIKVFNKAFDDYSNGFKEGKRVGAIEELKSERKYYMDEIDRCVKYINKLKRKSAINTVTFWKSCHLQIDLNRIEKRLSELEKEGEVKKK